VDIPLRSVRGRGLLVGTVLGSSLAILDGSVVNVALPHIGRDLHATLGGLQWTVNAYLLPLAAFVLIGGALGDRFGRRKMFLTGVVWFTAASVLCGLAPNIELLIAARALQGCGAALLTPGSLSLIQSSFRPDDRARAIGLWAGLGGVASAGGPLLGGYLIDALSWRWIFYINVPIALVCLLVVTRFVPESRDEEVTGRFDGTGAALGAVGLGALTYALVDAVWPAGLAGGVALIGFAVWEMRTRDPMMPTSMFRSVEFSVINFVTLLIYGALGGLIFFLILQLQEVSGFSAFEAGAALIPVTVIMLVGSSRAGALGKRIGARLPIGIGATIAAVGFGLLNHLGADASYWRNVFGPVVIVGVGMTLLVAPLTATVLAAAPNHLAGVASGINNAVARSGSLLAVAALPLVAGLSGDEYGDPQALNHAYRIAIGVCTGLLVLSAVLAFTLLHSRRPVEESSATRVGNP
jgi:EmrB/QacA subfamily drug resistance transporter